MRRRFLLAFIGVMVVMLAAHDLPLASFVRDVERDRLLASLERDAFVIAGAAEDLLSAVEDGTVGDGEVADDAALLVETVELYHARDGAHVVVADRSSVAVAVSDEQGAVGEDYANRPEVVAALTGTPTTGQRFSASLGGDLVYVAVPVRSGADIVGMVRITYDADVIDARANRTIRGVGVVALISLVGAAVTAVVLAWSVSAPLLRLQRTTERVARGDLASRADDDEGPREVRQLASAFNTMTARVNDLLDQQRSFAGDASHQLRTPLTALRLQLERATDTLDTLHTLDSVHTAAPAVPPAEPVRPGALPPPAALDVVRAQLEAATAETERLQRVVDALLVLARSEWDGAALAPVDVGRVVAGRVEMWAPLAAECDVAVRALDDATRPGRLVLEVSHALEQCLDNLVDNAIAVAPAGTSIDISVVAAADDAGERWVTVHVRDRGPGMTDEQLRHAADRFWRAPGAAHGGSGLGLAIVSHLATASGGALALARRDGGGLDAAVRFPVA